MEIYWLDLDPATMTLEEKLAQHRAYRTERYEKLIDAVHARWGRTSQGVPTLQTVRDLGIDHPEVLEVIQKHL